MDTRGKEKRMEVEALLEILFKSIERPNWKENVTTHIKKRT